MTADEFKSARKELGLTQSQMADTLTISKRGVQRFEAGDWEVSQRCAKQIDFLLRHQER